MGVALVVSGVAGPVGAEASRPDLAAAVGSPRAGEAVPKDAEGRVLLYVDGGQESVVRDAVAELGGEVSAAQGGRVQVAVPPDKVDELAEVPAIKEIRRPERAIPMAVTSEGVSASGADGWIRDGKSGAGVKVGLIDVGFDEVEDAQGRGEVPSGAVVNNANCHDVTTHSSHGTAVAEVVHDMAPGAELFLACVDGPLDFAPATEWLRQQGVQVITAAVGFLTSGRGDGTGEVGSPPDVVRKTREAGVFWSIAAGNLAPRHFSGKAVDANADKFVEFSGTAQNNGINLAGGAVATVGLRWDAWPRTTEDLDVYVMSSAQPPTGPTDSRIVASSANNQRDVVGGGRPTEEVTFTNPSASAAQYYVYVKNNTARFTTRFDLFVSGPTDQLQFATAAGSVTEPATSPYAVAVGATQPGSGVVEAFSGQGPTIDGRVKPDITAFDKVTTSTYTTTPFEGTSVAAAHVAGAAALLKSANPQLDAAQIQTALQTRTNPRKSDNLWGTGVLAMGTPDTVPVVTGAGYTALPKPLGIQARAFAPNEVFTLAIPNVPNDTTAVVLNLAVRTNPSAGPNVATGMDVFPGDPSASTSKATTVRVRPEDGFVSTMVVAKVGEDRAIRLRAGAGHAFDNVDLLGYFSVNGGSTYFAKP
ncbi:MAG: S8 family serine peptidase, partial [Umezawaea sp.]